jgi:hypothetical protein
MNNDHENQVSHFEERAQIEDSGKQNIEDNIYTKPRFKMVDLEKFS